MTRAAVIGLGLVAALLAFAVPYAARGGMRPDGGDAKAAEQRGVPGPSAKIDPIGLGGVPPLPPLRWVPPRAAGSSPTSPAAGATPAPPGASVPRVVVAPRRAAPPAPSPQPAPPSGGGGSFDDSG